MSSQSQCTDIELPHKIQSNFAARVHKNLLRLLHRRSLKKDENGKGSDSKSVVVNQPQHKLIERLRSEEGLAPLPKNVLGNTQNAIVRRPSSDVRDSLSMSSPVRRGSLFSFPKFRPEVTLATHMSKLSLNVIQAQRRSSTSSACVKDTISNPNRSELLLCISYALYYHMSTGMQTKVKLHDDIFSEKLHPMTKDKPNFSKMPPLETVYNFLKGLYEHSKCDHEVIIMSLAYIERLLELSKLTFDSSNWRRITLAAFIVADKAWNDLAVWNEDFLALFKGFVKIRDLNALEMKFLNLIQYKIFLKSSMYTKYYFELKVFSKMSPGQKLLPPAQTKAEKAEATLANQKALSRQNRRSQSLDTAALPSRAKQMLINVC